MGANEKAAATYHPRTFECAYCDREWSSPDAAEACCDDAWLRAID